MPLFEGSSPYIELFASPLLGRRYQLGALGSGFLVSASPPLGKQLSAPVSRLQVSSSLPRLAFPFSGSHLPAPGSWFRTRLPVLRFGLPTAGPWLRSEFVVPRSLFQAPGSLFLVSSSWFPAPAFWPSVSSSWLPAPCYQLQSQLSSRPPAPCP